MNSGKVRFVNVIALFDVVFPPRVWNFGGGMFGMHWNLLGNVDQWNIVLVDPESNKTLRILLDGQALMDLHLATVHDNNFSMADTCFIGADAW